MNVLVFGGTVHVGRAVVDAALRAGAVVTAVNRGVSGALHPSVGPDGKTVTAEHLVVDRTDVEALTAVLAGRRFDLVVDTWSQAPWVVSVAAAVCESLTPRYVYVSSRSVYRWPIPAAADESAPVVHADPDAEATAYAADKRGGELAVLRVFGPERCVLARAGLILGPWEHVGRLPWWLRRIAAGGDVVAPGPIDRPLQYVDCRDLADYLLTTTAAGPVNTVSAAGHATIGGLLLACLDATGSRARLVWVDPDDLAARGVTGWVDLPVWTPPTGELAALHDSDTTRAAATGLMCRPIADTVQACWDWTQAEGGPAPSLQTAGLGLSAAKEAEILATAIKRL